MGLNGAPGWQPELLRAARQARGWTQAELAAKVGVSREVVGQWESGRAPRAERVARLADLLGLRTQQLAARAAGLAGLRVSAGLTQAQLGAAIGVSRSTVHSLEHGKFALSPDLTAAYADALGVPLTEIQAAARLG